MCNFVDATPKHLHDELYGKVRAILDAPDVETVRLLLNQIVANYSKKAPKAIQVLENGFDDITAVLSLPERYRKWLRTTNGMERLNEEIRRRYLVIRIDSNRNSVVLLVSKFLIEFDVKWQSGHQYLDMRNFFIWREVQQRRVKDDSKFAKIGLSNTLSTVWRIYTTFRT